MLSVAPRTLRILLTALLSASLLSACAAGDERDAGEFFDAYFDAGPVLEDAGPQPDAGPDADVPPRDSGPMTGLACSACAADTDCDPGSYCVELAAGGGVCLRSCDMDLPDCPARFDCINSLITPTPTPVCTPIGERCCIDADFDDHGSGVGCRGADCDDTNPAVFEGATEVCDGMDTDCNGMVDDGDPGGGLVCSTGLSGACSAGTSTCTDGAVVCMPAMATMMETCDGTDEDCDGNVDEDAMGLVLTQSCYDGPAGTEGTGGCAAGVRTCTGGMFRGCVGQILPGTEICNGVDDDCDAMVDDGNPGGGFSCITTLPGLCSAGMTECTGGSVMCVSTTAPGSMPEICDDVDNDCDGMLNEGFSGIGSACIAGRGTCRRVGLTLCDPSDSSAPPICDAVAGTPSPAEMCDYVDDDCDGSTDEGFRDSAGVYSTVGNCGACGFDCDLGWPGGPALFNLTPTCDVSGMTATCGFTCLPGYIDADGVRDNGCELFPEPGTIYVSRPSDGGVDGGSCGAWDSPCATITFGISRASSAGRSRVRVSSGLFVENVTLADGISLLGGHNRVNWVRNPAVFATSIRGADAAVPVGSADDRIAVVAANITSATELSGFSITAINGGPGANSIAIYVRDSDEDLLIRDNDVLAGSGGNGATGAPGMTGTAGSVGFGGQGPVVRVCGSTNSLGPAGGSRSCSGISVHGGAGGSALNPTTSFGAPTRSGNGSSGLTGRGGPGGTGGFNVEGSGGSTCFIYGSPTEGGVGRSGIAGSDQAGGAGGAGGVSSIVSGQWRGAGGVVGRTGNPGGGGGGGGSPGGVFADGGARCIYSATGGSGGSGGCPGTGGRGASSGGASFALFLVFTSTPTVGTMPVIVMNTLRRNTGGRGGDGGTGGGGGDGAAGGNGGPRTSGSSAGDSYEFCLSAGAPGGAGGRGGHSGGGGGGAGGASFDIWVSRPGSAAPDYSMNTFDIAAGSNTGGSGGLGGNSSNTLIGIGGPGGSGTFGTTRIGS